LQLEEGFSDFNNFWYEYSQDNLPLNRCSISHLTHSMFVHYWEKQNQQNLAFLPKAVLLLNLNNAQKHILITFLTLWLTFHRIFLFFNCLEQNCLKYGCTLRTQTRRCFSHSLTAESIMFCFKLIQTSPVTSWIH